MGAGELIVNGERIEVANYLRFHRKRIRLTLEALRKLEAKKIVELGGHPWVMTSAFLDECGVEVAATVSAEEITNWPDDIGVTRREYRMKTIGGREVSFPNYSANIERTRFEIQEQPDTVIACEIIEHLVRSPHIMLLNINHWLPVSGKLLISTPNGVQFSNPFRRKSSRPSYRCNVYARHNGAFSLNRLLDLVQLCGFGVLEASFWNTYERAGLSRIYDALGSLPAKSFKERFHRTIFIVAEKQQEVKELPCLPLCYEPSKQWEFIANADIERFED